MTSLLDICFVLTSLRYIWQNLKKLGIKKYFQDHLTSLHNTVKKISIKCLSNGYATVQIPAPCFETTTVLPKHLRAHSTICNPTKQSLHLPAYFSLRYSNLRALLYQPMSNVTSTFPGKLGHVILLSMWSFSRAVTRVFHSWARAFITGRLWLWPSKWWSWLLAQYSNKLYADHVGILWLLEASVLWAYLANSKTASFWVALCWSLYRTSLKFSYLGHLVSFGLPVIQHSVIIKLCLWQNLIFSCAEAIAQVLSVSHKNKVC